MGREESGMIERIVDVYTLTPNYIWAHVHFNFSSIKFFSCSFSVLFHFPSSLCSLIIYKTKAFLFVEFTGLMPHVNYN